MSKGLIAHAINLTIVATVLVTLSITNTLTPTAVAVLLAAAGITGVGVAHTIKHENIPAGVDAVAVHHV